MTPSLTSAARSPSWRSASSAWSAATPDLGPWEPTERPPVWVLFDGVWCRGYLLQWYPPAEPGQPWRGAARWEVGTLQYETWVWRRWLAPRRGEDGQEIPPPPVPPGEVGMLPVDGRGR